MCVCGSALPLLSLATMSTDPAFLSTVERGFCCSEGHGGRGWGAVGDGMGADSLSMESFVRCWQSWECCHFFCCFSTADPGPNLSVCQPPRSDCSLCPVGAAPQPFTPITSAGAMVSKGVPSVLSLSISLPVSTVCSDNAPLQMFPPDLSDVFVY